MSAQWIDLHLIFGWHRIERTTEWTTYLLLYRGIEVESLHKRGNSKRDLVPRLGLDGGIQLFEILFYSISSCSETLAAGIYTTTAKEVVLGNLEHFP